MKLDGQGSPCPVGVPTGGGPVVCLEATRGPGSSLPDVRDPQRRSLGCVNRLSYLQFDRFEINRDHMDLNHGTIAVIHIHSA
jgi:hypothetical protein